MLSAIVVDDEPGVRADLVRILRGEPDVRVVGAAATVAEAAELVRRHRPDVVFLDIHLEGESGFRLLRETDGTDPAVVFVTAYDEYAVRAFEVNALDYLLKPVEPDRLRAALDRVRAARRPGAEEPSDPRPLRYDDWLFLPLRHGRGFLRVRAIGHITAEGDYTAVHTTDGQRHLVLQPLGRWEARLPAPYFLRVHRSTIVNLERVERVEPGSNYTYRLYLRGYPDPVVMSRSYARRAERLLG